MATTATTPLLERESFLETLADLLTEAARDRGRLVLLGGDAGVGEDRARAGPAPAGRPRRTGARGRLRLRKLDARTRAEAASAAVALGLIQPA
jgi:hypothetical protein